MWYWIERKAFFLGDGLSFDGWGGDIRLIFWKSMEHCKDARYWRSQDCLFCRLKDATTETEGCRKNPSPFLQNTACTFKRKKGFYLEEHHIFIFEVVKF